MRSWGERYREKYHSFSDIRNQETIQGQDIPGWKGYQKGKRPGTLPQLVGVLPQNPQSLFVGNTVEEDLWEMFSGPSVSAHQKEEYRQKMQCVIEDTEIGHLLHMHPYDLSGGEQQRTALAKVLLLEPQIFAG